MIGSPTRARETRIALEIAVKILRNNAIDTYRLDLPKFSFG